MIIFAAGKAKLKTMDEIPRPLQTSKSKRSSSTPTRCESIDRTCNTTA
eukprot:CAMPEP_0184271302 /NCGR_PEP_ID=MMETSP0977-20130417/39018_1 /TAXON_ID=483370 /ORGANISM="non described non described, Strain CCMP2097" /LENGTH=47 /DNA_ID= /DNA_START= /DNA_END= /DNA_ORIENTATION=